MRFMALRTMAVVFLASGAGLAGCGTNPDLRITAVVVEAADAGLAYASDDDQLSGTTFADLELGQGETFTAGYVVTTSPAGATIDELTLRYVGSAACGDRTMSVDKTFTLDSSRSVAAWSGPGAGVFPDVVAGPCAAQSSGSVAVAIRARSSTGLERAAAGFLAWGPKPMDPPEWSGSRGGIGQGSGPDEDPTDDPAPPDRKAGAFKAATFDEATKTSLTCGTHAATLTNGSVARPGAAITVDGRPITSTNLAARWGFSPACNVLAVQYQTSPSPILVLYNVALVQQPVTAPTGPLFMASQVAAPVTDLYFSPDDSVWFTLSQSGPAQLNASVTAAFPPDRSITAPFEVVTPKVTGASLAVDTDGGVNISITHGGGTRVVTIPAP